jgi:hypothetical protein
VDVAKNETAAVGNDHWGERGELNRRAEGGKLVGSAGVVVPGFPSR